MWRMARCFRSGLLSQIPRSSKSCRVYFSGYARFFEDRIRRGKKPLHIRPAVPLKRDPAQRWSYPPAPALPKGEPAHGVVGTLMRLLACFDPEAPQRQSIKHILSSPPLLLLALRNIENRRQQRPPSRTDVVLEALAIATELLELVYCRLERVMHQKIPPDTALLRCFLRPSRLNTRHFIQSVWNSSFSKEDKLFLIRAVQELRWNTSCGRSRCHDSSWRLASNQSSIRKGPLVFRKDVQNKITTSERAESFGLGSVNRPEWRSLPWNVYTRNDASWILSHKNLSPVKTRRRDSEATATRVASMRLRPPEALTARNAEGQRRRGILLRRLYVWEIYEAFSDVRRQFNQHIVKYKSPDKIPVVDKPAPTMNDLERRVSHMMRRMVPNIHAQRSRGMQIRDRTAEEGALAIYWYDARYSDILASIAVIENRLLASGLRLRKTHLEEPHPRELRDLRNKSA